MLVEGTDMDKVAASNSIEKFSYSPSQNSGGWRTTKTKVSLEMLWAFDQSLSAICPHKSHIEFPQFCS